MDLRPQAAKPSICIPCLDTATSKEEVCSVIERHGFGEVERVDLVANPGGRAPGKRAFIHFVSWDKSPEAREVRSRLLAGDYVNVIHRFPWFWRCHQSLLPKPYGR
jgi:hypothetical protein